MGLNCKRPFFSVVIHAFLRIIQRVNGCGESLSTYLVPLVTSSTFSSMPLTTVFWKVAKVVALPVRSLIAPQLDLNEKS